MCGGVIPKFDDERVAIEGGLNDAALHAAAAPVDESHLDDLVAALDPRRMTVVGDFSVRGGIKTMVTARYQKSDG